MNPLFWLDMRVRVRERRLWVIALFCLVIPLLICLLAMGSAFDSNRRVEPGEIGMIIAITAVFCQAGLIVILAPLAAAQRIAQEREQRTYPALVNAPLSPSAIARGKLAGAWLFTLWISMLTLPFMLLAGLWGGLSGWVVPVCFGLNLLAGMMLSSLALGFSGLLGRSMSAYLACGALLFLWMFALPIIGTLSMGIMGSSELRDVQAAFMAFLLHNPFAPQIWMVLRATGESSTYTDWGWWVPLYGVAVWIGVLLLGFKLAVHGLRREVF